ncbi:hypothetical protein HPB50_010597 [Hyalomma asiaticum]|uniref:Uncharacterized protein n=1 Tax=Hyalomma asiaticum TaxID=266040 RepID=A0ACB7S1R3_HYAAI|nr:hypothetical protein HPB50_010597 [Hyalomma asiaticum]
MEPRHTAKRTFIVSSDRCDHTPSAFFHQEPPVGTLTCGSSADAPRCCTRPLKPGWTTTTTTLKMDEEELAVAFARVRRRNRQTGFL